MFRKMRLGSKIFAGFIVVLILLGVVAYLGYWGLSSVGERVGKSNAVQDITLQILTARGNEKDFMLWDTDESVTAALDNVQQTESMAKDLRARFTDPVNIKQMDDVLAGTQAYGEAFDEMVDLNNARDKATQEMTARATEALKEAVAIQEDQRRQLNEYRDSNLAKIEQAATTGGDIAAVARDGDTLVDEKLVKADGARDIMVAFYEAQDDQKSYMITLDDQYSEAVNQQVDACIDQAKKLLASFKQQQNIDQGTRLVASLENYKEAFQSYLDVREREEKMVTTMRTSADAAVKECADASADQEAKMNAEMASANHLMVLTSLVAIAAGLVAAFGITRSITKPLNRIMLTLNSGSEQVGGASGQLAESSQQMSEGASEQASSLEEISASLEEMASMTRQNADSARQADTMTVEAKGAAEKGAQAMERMADAIGQIKGSSDETAKIIKTIDEIAFQTNLLALNAAVEAARAGEAGKGFAVVAEEVRNLAQRSAEAAKNTASLIEGAQVNAANGVTVSAEVAEVFAQVGGAIDKVTQLVSEVAAASGEQAQGIDQVNTAVAQLDKVTQSNAASSEEAASASEELSAQAEALGQVVNDLRGLVEGARGSAQYSGVVQSTGTARRNGQRRTLALRNGAADTKRLPVATGAQRTGDGARLRPDQVIPLSEDDLAEF